jgi:5-methylcytosine-specific restriction endonuclease McrA
MSPARRRGGRKRKSGPKRPPQHSSQPTSRVAYAETREWLLKSHGPICAYCGVTYSPRSLTLDHVTPRKGQSAYDRRDNLVLACKRCNTAKADKPFLAYVIGHPSRAENLLRYGQHLSDGILSILRPMVGDIVIAAPAPRPARKKQRFNVGADDGESPYRDHESPYRKSA